VSSPVVLHNSSFSAPVEAAALTPVQAQVVASLAQGHTVTAAGIRRTAIEEARSQFTASIADQLNELSATALQTLRALLESPDTPPAIRLRAPLTVLGRPDTSRSRLESPRMRQTSDLADTRSLMSVGMRMKQSGARYNPVGSCIEALDPERAQACRRSSAKKEASSPLCGV
jgi:hypothetical protein